MGVGRRFIRSQQVLSLAFDSLLPSSYRVDGNRDFREDFAPRYLRPGTVVLDVGGGKHPFVDPETKRFLDLQVIGVDIDAEELRLAPSGAYDSVICCDVEQLDLPDSVDIAVCQAVLEHVRDTRGAIASIARALRPGGRFILFAPSRNAIFARLNLVFPERFKRWVLFWMFPQTRQGQGFAAFYDRCTPRDVVSAARSQGLVLLEKRTYYLSRYFAFLFPLYVLWRAWTVVFRALVGDQAAESFSLAFEKPKLHATATG